MVVPFRDEYQKRLYQANDKILEMYGMLDPMDENYSKDLEALAKMQKEVAEDFKNFAELDIEEERVKHEKKSSKIGHILQGAGLGVTLFTFIGGLVFKDKAFKRASKYEDENAYLKMSDRAAVNDALKETETPKFWQFWKR